MVKTEASHAFNIGSNPVRVTSSSDKKQLTGSAGCANIKRLEAERLLTINDGGKRHPYELVLIAVRVHLFPSRTQKLSSHAPTILGGRLPGKIGNANTNIPP